MSIGTTVVNWTKGTLYSFREARLKDKELASLKHEVRSLKNQVLQVSTLDKKLKAYEDLLALKQSSSLPSVAANVIGYNTTSQYPSLTIEFARSVAISPGLAVFGVSGIVGRISKVAGPYATVSLVGSPKQAIDVETENSHVHGVLKASGGSRYLFKLRFVPQHEQIKIGDRLVTTGAAGIFPSNMAVGEVVRVRQDASQLYQNIDVNLAATSFIGEEVLVSLKNKKTSLQTEQFLEANGLNP